MGNSSLFLILVTNLGHSSDLIQNFCEVCMLHFYHNFKEYPLSGEFHPLCEFLYFLLMYMQIQVVLKAKRPLHFGGMQSDMHHQSLECQTIWIHLPFNSLTLHGSVSFLACSTVAWYDCICLLTAVPL